MINSIKLYYQNVRGLRTKVNDIFQSILSNNFDLIFITETWLNNSFLDSEVSDARYDIFRYDRDTKSSDKSIGGGVMIYAKQMYQAQLRSEFSRVGVELVWITIGARGFGITQQRAVHLGVAYVPGDMQHSQRLALVLDSLNAIMQAHPDDHIILLGDFNMPNIQWDSRGGPTCAKEGTNEKFNTAVTFMNALQFHGLLQFNKYPNFSGNVLDLVIANTNLNISISTDPLLSEDKYHPALEIDSSEIFIAEVRPRKFIKYLFQKADYDHIKKDLSLIKWNIIFQNNSVDESLNCFYEILYKLINDYVPKHVVGGKYNYPVWYSRALINVIREKDKIHHKWKAYGNSLDYDEFKLLRDRQKQMQKTCFKRYVLYMQDHILKSPEVLHTYVRSKRKKASNYPNIMYYDNEIYDDELKICQGFNKYFKSVFVDYTLNYTEQNYNVSSFSDENLHMIRFTETEILKIFKSLNIRKGSGSDNIPPIFFKNCANEIAFPVMLLYNKSLSEGIFPSKWKEAHIVPIHKKGSKTEITNYRPISILNILGKVLEKLIYTKLYSVLSRAIPDNQHGFMKRRSTNSNLIQFTSDILNYMDEGYQVDVIYTDFEKAFDRVDHVILMKKLYALGIRGDLFRWMKSYVSNRKQSVRLGGSRSDYVCITSGVPQGSHLGPLLYNVYLFDIRDCFKHSKFSMFADDKKVYMRVNSIADCLLIQSDLDRLSEYYRINRITVNVKKCSQITFTRKKTSIDHAYIINNSPINKTNLVRDLGILLDSKLQMNEHINYITNKAYRSLGFVIRSCIPFKNINCLKNVYFALVRSILEYGSCVWNPQFTKYIDAIEAIQVKFIKQLNFKIYRYFGTYEESCKHFHIASLRDRRELLDLMLIHNLVSGSIDSPELLSCLNFNVPIKRTRITKSNIFHVPTSHTKYAANSFFSRVPLLYNEKYSHIDFFHLSADSFRNQIKRLQST